MFYTLHIKQCTFWYHFKIVLSVNHRVSCAKSILYWPNVAVESNKSNDVQSWLSTAILMAIVIDTA